MATTTSTQKSTIVSVFDSYTDAQAAVRDLTDAGVPREDISLVANDKEGTYSSELSGSGGSSHHEGSGMGSKVAGGAAIGGIGGLLLGLGALAIPGIGPIIAAGPIAAALGGAAIGAAGGGIVGALKDVGVPDEDASFYSEHVRRGGTLLTVQADSSMHDHIHSILERHDPVSVDDRMEEFRSSGWSAPDPSSASYVNQTSTPVTQTSTPTTRSNYTAERVQGGEQSIPVVEEQMVVGKREVQRGGVRLYTRVVERPVQEEVTVRDETIRIDRRKVDRPVDPSSLNETEKVLEIVEVDEEPVVGKTARVIEEVVVGKDVTQRTETVRDTVRRRDVEVDQLGSTDYDTDFRSDFQTRFANVRGASYETYAPAYQYGYRMAGDTRYKGRSYNEIENDIRTEYMRSNPNSNWESMKDAVRHGWDKMTGKR